VVERTVREGDSASLVAIRQFIQATRDSGYKSTSAAVSELVDNALQAGAQRVQVRVEKERDEAGAPIRLSVQDDGEGMTSAVLRHALRFGGSSRFDDRSGLGRYGMGLPNSSLSQARRLDVFTWRVGQEVTTSYLDLDEIASGAMVQVPVPQQSELPEWAELEGDTGTLIAWSRCDRLDYKYAGRVASRLQIELGRIFRHFIWGGVVVTVNDEVVQGSDPLFLHERSIVFGAERFGGPLRFEISLPFAGDSQVTGEVTVTFSELPVQAWHHLSNAEKRRLGVTKGAGVSVVRGGREIDYGWFFMDGKRRESYDDWWRCEIRFEPELDDVFGITHTKQQIRPSVGLLEALSPDLGGIARALNARVRRAHQAVKARARYAGAESRASAVESRLTPLPLVERVSLEDSAQLKRLTALYPELVLPPKGGQLEYRLVEDSLKSTHLYEVIRSPGRILVALNTAHPFYERVYAPLIRQGTPEADARRGQLDLLFLALARAEAAEPAERQHQLLDFRGNWANALAEMMKE
jgi:anti-sigma regulatory factor (Ser/Thr protein kinase)